MTWMNAAKLASDTYDLHCHEYSSMYTAEITSNQFEGRGRTLTFADDVLLNNRAVKDEMPKVFIDDKEINRVHVLPYLGLLFDRALSRAEHITKTITLGRMVWL